MPTTVVHRESPATLHDRVIEAVVKQDRVHAVYANVHGHSNVCVTVRDQELYPDLVLCDRETFRVEHVMEVETPETISPERARFWLSVARGPWQFWLVVPKAVLAGVAALCEQYGVHAHLAAWSAPVDRILIEWPAVFARLRPSRP